MSTPQKLKFRIAFSSSEEEGFSVTELLKQGPQSKGWQSARFCEYPQEIILQFSAPVRIRQLQFLSHQSKISSKIELYTFLPEDPGMNVNFESANFKRLGYLSLNSNEQSGFQARELKSVYIDTPSMYLKILLNKCHNNKYNLFNQVGLIAINALGEMMNEKSGGGQRSVMPERLENELEFDPVTADRLKALFAAKQRAIDNEDFDEAKRLKDTIERLKAVGYQLLQLEERKRNAIENEDFDSAKIIKTEIERLRNTAAPPVGMQGGPNYFAPVQASSHRPFSGGLQPLGNRPGSRPQPNQMKPARPLEFGDDMFAARQNQMYPDQIGGNHDEQVLPTLMHGRGPGQYFEEENPGMYEPNTTAEPLSVQAQNFADPLLPILGEEICRQIFSRTWQQREEGLTTIENELRMGGASNLFGGADNASVLMGAIGAVRYTVEDKVTQVSTRAMSVLKTALDGLSPSRTQLRGDTQDYLNHVMKGLLEKAGDNQVRLRETAEQMFIQLARSDLIGPGNAVNHILRPMKNKVSSQKHIIGRLSILNNIVREFRIDNQHVPFQPVVEYALNGFKNSNGEVRNASYNLLLTIYSHVGGRINPYLQDLRPAQQEMLTNGFAEIDGGGGKPMPFDDQPVRVPSRKQAQQPQQPAESQLPRCDFCGKREALFSNQDNLDIHWWKDCPMLMNCPLCNQTVEILRLNGHLLKECDLKDVMRECPRCKEALHVDEYEQHVDEQACLSAKPASVANRCPLCHEDVDPGIEGWKQHILVEGCPNNDRSNY